MMRAYEEPRCISKRKTFDVLEQQGLPVSFDIMLYSSAARFSR